MKLYELIKKGSDELAASGVPDEKIDADILWQYVSDMTRMEMLMNRDDEVGSELESRYMYLINRRCQRIPLQYITGEQNFMGYDFDTAENVLIPRMDTETLVETALRIVKERFLNAGRSLNVLDMCCGSGCIGISFGLFVPGSTVTLADISEDALRLTRKNVEKLCDDKARFKVLKSDMFTDIDGKFDMILSNPPYIRSSVIQTLMPEVRDHEPLSALDGTEDGLYFYRKIVDTAKKYIKDEGYVVFEIGNDQAEDVQHLFVDSGYSDIHVVKDLSENDRVVYARYTE